MTEKFAGECWITVPDPDGSGHAEAAKKFDLNVVKGRHANGLQKDGFISFGSNSGHQALHLAVNWGAKRVILLGYDFCGTGHWFGEHPTEIRGGHAFDSWIAHMNKLAVDLKRAGVEVINCTRTTALTCFPRAAIEDLPDVKSDSD